MRIQRMKRFVFEQINKQTPKIINQSIKKALRITMCHTEPPNATFNSKYITNIYTHTYLIDWISAVAQIAVDLCWLKSGLNIQTAGCNIDRRSRARARSFRQRMCLFYSIEHAVACDTLFVMISKLSKCSKTLWPLDINWAIHWNIRRFWSGLV